MNEELKVSIRCPTCRQKLLEKVEGATGKIQTVCPRCKSKIEIDLYKDMCKSVQRFRTEGIAAYRMRFLYQQMIRAH